MGKKRRIGLWQPTVQANRMLARILGRVSPGLAETLVARILKGEQLKSTFTLDRTGRAVGFDLNYSSIFKIWSVNLIVDEMGPVERVDADTAPLAICRAALKAVMR